ncbi:MAG: ATP-dependent DNA helicase RecG [Oscillospiraceae bacterium]|nr:ATP-dependent DNA helicase RecG [Oscillospiraceae bacterium]
MAYQLTDSIQILPGIGPARAKRLEKLGILSLRDLLFWFPRNYEDRRELFSIAEAPEDRSVCVRAMVATPPRATHIRKGLELVKVSVVDDRETMEITFFNQAYVRTALTPGMVCIFFGSVQRKGRRYTMTNPVFEPEEGQRFTQCIMPVYPLTAGISNNLLAGALRRVLEDCTDQLEEPLPREILRRHQLAQVGYAVRTVHFPPSWEELEVAKRRLVFEELFLLSLGLSMLKGSGLRRQGIACASHPLKNYTDTLPFTLTDAQLRTIGEAFDDMTSGRAMNRLVQGDVGSGKTVVGAACAWLMAKNGCQSALMAPTEILAEQHWKTLSPLLERSGQTVALLTGSTRAKERRELLARLEAGEIDLLIGTHALLTQNVVFRRLGLVITDEQHRFGVGQRSALVGKHQQGEQPHVLVMSATPIPRTLALIVYGDLDVSVIDQRPPGRQEVQTLLIGEDKRQRMYGFIRKQVEEGHQVYLVCPAVEESEGMALLPGGELKNVTDYARELRESVFPDLKIGLLHGKLKPKEKEAAMAAFARGETQLLVATTVIEVGVDVPNATLIVIENAERFGLSQLHQLRGRVGRGSSQSYCVLVSSARGQEARQRLRALCATNDGFQIAEEDLKLRGPGDFFGSRQHGLPPLKVADLAGDTRVLYEAKQAAQSLLEEDPQLSLPGHRQIRSRVEQLFEANRDTFN